MNSRNHLIKVIRAFWANRRDNACFISHMEDNGLFTLEPENDDVKTYYRDDNGVDHLQDGSLHCTCGAGRNISAHMNSLNEQMETMQQHFNDAINFTLDEAEGEGILFLQLWREGDWESIRNEFPKFKSDIMEP